MRDTMEKAPLFVKISEYKKALEKIDKIKKNLTDAHNTIEKIKELRNKEEVELNTWVDNLADVEHHISTIDQNLFEPEVQQ